MEATINGIDCYGKVIPGDSIEVHCENEHYDMVLDNADFTTWEQVINWLKAHRVPKVVELVADN